MGWPPCRRFDPPPPSQKSVATPLSLSNSQISDIGTKARTKPSIGYPSNSQGITTAPRLQNHTLQPSSARLSSAPFSDKALTCPTKLQQSTRLSLARIKRGPSLSLPTSPPPLRVLSGLQQRQGLLQADHRRRDALAVEYAVCQISAGMYIHLRPRALLARTGSAKQGRPGIQPACPITDLSLFHF